MRDVVAAYSIFPNLGVRSEPHLLERIVDQKGGEVYKYEGEQKPAIDAGVAYVIHSLMRGVVLRGTAARLSGMGMDYLAGKTGTTSNYRDAWFVGYAPDLLTAVWVGFDDGTPLRMSSGEAAVPIFATYMQRADHIRDELRPPDGVSLVEVEAMTGRRWQPGCGESVVEVFLRGTEPAEQCGGYMDGSMAMGGYVEPPMISEEQAAAMEAMAQEMAMRQSEMVHDPDSMDVSSDDTGNVIIDDSLRESRPIPQSTPFPVRPSPAERRRRERAMQIPPPPPPEIDSEPPPPPPPPPIRRDTLEAILIGG
jgi:membrane carboxypeptidase/penicillin-binding protein